jgi:hypothetical protein
MRKNLSAAVFEYVRTHPGVYTPEIVEALQPSFPHVKRKALQSVPAALRFAANSEQNRALAISRRINDQQRDDIYHSDHRRDVHRLGINIRCSASYRCQDEIVGIR